jgi:ABC-2 type transport system permease protein
VFLAFCVMGVMGPPMFGFGAFVATEREQGLVKLKRALPAPPASYLLAKTAMAVLFSVLIIITTTFAAITLGRLRLSLGHILSIGIVSIGGALPFCAMGLLIGTLASGKSAPAFVNLLYLPMIYLSGLFFPLPPSIHWIQFLSPAYYLYHLAMGVGGVARPGAGIDIAVLTGVTILFGILAIRRFDRVG